MAYSLLNSAKKHFFQATYSGGLLLTICFSAQATPIYTCEINGDIVYTSRPSKGCQSADLPSIGRYSSSRYDEPQVRRIESVNPEPQKQKSVSASKKKPITTANKKRTDANKATQSKPQTSAAAPVQKAPVNNSRRHILEQELQNERKALADAQKSLTQARAIKNGTINSEQIRNMESNVFDRTQNIQALQRELGRM